MDIAEAGALGNALGGSAAWPAASPLDPLAATWAIAQRCDVDLDFGTYHFPQVALSEGETAYSLLAKRCFRGIARRYKPVPPRALYGRATRPGQIADIYFDVLVAVLKAVCLAGVLIIRPLHCVAERSNDFAETCVDL